ncbi:MAG: bifunctional pyr operon transcriptional regulator/uracil phosphoribosyltransferase PyrR [Planctomycetota bacterium]|nr:bifunctional pyr operon transcriptional regulator/uracil phosphoribosyltransferase PyrR [Planctomycetota bacterium]
MAKTKTAARGKPEKQLHDAAWIAKQVDAFSKDILAQGLVDRAMVVGIRRRGAELARRVCKQIGAASKLKVPYGALNITLYRDDMSLRGPTLREKSGTEIEGPVDNRVIYLIDDVLFTGRTIRAAMDLLMDFGRPGAVRLYEIVDRGGRELPIQPDRVAERLSVPLADRVEVRLKEVDGQEGVFVVVGGMR